MPKYTEYQQIFRVGKVNPPSIQAETRTSKRKIGLWPSSNQEIHGIDKSKDGATGRKAQNGRNRHTKALTDSNKVSEAQNRLQKLEQIVASLIHAEDTNPRTSKQPTPPYSNDITPAVHLNKRLDFELSPENIEDLDQVKDTPKGHLEIRSSETSYLGATHWATILEDIKDIQDCLANDLVDEVSDRLENVRTDEDDMILGGFRPITLDKACFLLPPRPVADKFCLVILVPDISTYVSFIHKGKFLKEYESFWASPTSVPMLWVSILFSALHLGFWASQNPENPFDESINQFTMQQPFDDTAAQLLVAGQYQKGRPYSVEALYVYGICKFLTDPELQSEPWLLMGVCARLALKLGYHRDPRHLAHVSPFEGEMRRRAFYSIRILDLLLSFQAGLPATIHEDVCDADAPRNLFDEDFDENCTELPPSRPDTDCTNMSYYRYKGQFAFQFSHVARIALMPKMLSYDETMRLDRELRILIDNIPPFLVMKPLRLSITDETSLILQRCNIAFMYNKNLMILHRNYVSYKRADPTYAYSRRTALEASLQVLDLQAEIHAGLQPGGQLHSRDWQPTNISNHDCFLAAMIACLDLYESHRQGGAVAISGSVLATQKRTYEALIAAREIWASQASHDRDSRRAVTMITVMLNKIPLPTEHPPDSSNHQLQANIGGVDRAPAAAAPAPSYQPSMTMPPSTTVLEQGASGFGELDVPVSGSERYFEELLKDSEIDWSMIDQYIISQNDHD